MANNSDELEKALEQVEAALIDKDLGRASALLNSVSSKEILENERFQELVNRVRFVSDSRDSIQKMLSEAAHLLKHDDPHQAKVLFKKVVEISPDEPLARAGLQECRRKIDQMHSINLIIQNIRQHRESGDFKSAREYCREWLQYDPSSEQAQDILRDLERIISREREILVLLNQSQELMDLGRNREAIDLLEKLKDLAPGTTSGEELLAKAVNQINSAGLLEIAEAQLDDARRLMNQGHYEAASKRLNTIETENSDLVVEIKLLRRKIATGLEDQETEANFTRKVFEAIGREDLDDARVWLNMVIELNPSSEIFHRLRLELDPETYSDLTH